MTIRTQLRLHACAVNDLSSQLASENRRFRLALESIAKGRGLDAELAQGALAAKAEPVNTTVGKSVARQDEQEVLQPPVNPTPPTMDTPHEKALAANQGAYKCQHGVALGLHCHDGCGTVRRPV